MIFRLFSVLSGVWELLGCKTFLIFLDDLSSKLHYSEVASESV